MQAGRLHLWRHRGGRTELARRLRSFDLQEQTVSKWRLSTAMRRENVVRERSNLIRSSDLRQAIFFCMRSSPTLASLGHTASTESSTPRSLANRLCLSMKLL